MKLSLNIGVYALVIGLLAMVSPALASDEGQAEALLRDIDRIVAVESQQGWLIDRLELEDTLPQALQSVCRCRAQERQRALESARVRFHSEGGDVKTALEAVGGDPDEIEPLLDAHRAVLILEYALSKADVDCPLWLGPSAEFRGRQTDRDRFSIYFEGGGLLTLRTNDLETRYGGGGSSRVLLGYRSGSLAWLMGGELGGAGLVQPDEPNDQVRFHMFSAVPVALRVHGVLWHVGLEMAPVWSLPVSRDPARLGGRAALQVGYTPLRRGAWLPGLGFAIAYEHSPAYDGLVIEHIIRAGFRGSFSWDPNHGP
jgi:hypothetical protein